MSSSSSSSKVVIADATSNYNNRKRKHSTPAEEERFNFLFSTYHKLLKKISELQNREIALGDEYDEAKEEQCDIKLAKLSKRALELHKYLVRKQRIVDDNNVQLKADERSVLQITGTGNSFLDEAVTNHINSRTSAAADEFGLFGYVTRSIDIDELKEIVEQLMADGKLQGCVDSEESKEQFITNAYICVHMQIKEFLQHAMQERIEEDEQIYSEDLDSTTCSQTNTVTTASTTATTTSTTTTTTSTASACSWTDAKMKLLEAVANGSLSVDELSNEQISTGDQDEEDEDDEGDEDEDDENDEGDEGDRYEKTILDNNNDAIDLTSLNADDDSDKIVTDNNGSELEQIDLGCENDQVDVKNSPNQCSRATKSDDTEQSASSQATIITVESDVDSVIVIE